MIDLSLGEMLEIAREAELQRRLEVSGDAFLKGELVRMPEDMRGKLGTTGEVRREGPYLTAALTLNEAGGAVLAQCRETPAHDDDEEDD